MKQTMGQVRLRIDGKEVTAPAESTVLEAAQAAGMRIPTLCHHPALAPYGACRLCVVEDPARGALLASCVTPVREGLEVLTSSSRVLAARREILSLLMASHPESCIVCDRGNCCELRTLASELGLGITDLYRIPYVPPAHDLNLVLVRDMAKCVVCGRCVRADHEVVVRGAIDFSHRGFESRPAPLMDSSLEAGDCTLCGTCQTVCPTGAIWELQRPLKGHGADWTSTVCWLCGCGCAVQAASSHGAVVGIEPDPDGSSAGIALCVRGHYGYDHLAAPDRLTVPLVRRGPDLVEASWEDALDTAARGLRDVAQAMGPGATGVIGGSRSTDQEAYLLQRLARSALQTPNVDSGARLDAAVVLEALAEATGWPGGDCTLADLDQSDLILLFGADPDLEAPAAAYAIRRAIRLRGCRVVAVGPVRPHLASLGAGWIPAAGVELSGIAAALANALLDRGRTAPEDLKVEVPEGFRAQARAWRSTAPEGEAREAEIEKLAAEIARAHSPVVVCGRQVAAGLAAARWIVDVSLLADAKLLVLSADPNARGAIEMGLAPGLLPGGVPVGSAGLSYPQMLAAARDGKLRALLVVGENPLRALPGTDEVRNGLRSLQHLVVVDTYMGETASEASVVLPAAAAFERDGAFTSMEGRVQLIRRVVPPPGDARPELEILAELCRRLGSPVPADEAGLAAEIESLVPAYAQATRSIASLLPVPGPPPDLHPARGLRLVITVALQHAGSATRTSRSPRLRSLAPGPLLRLNPEDAAGAGLAEAGRALLAVGGREISVSFEAHDAVPPGIAAITPGPEVWEILPFEVDPSGQSPCTVVEGVGVRAAPEE